MSTVKRKKLQKIMGTWTWKKRSYKVIPGKIKDYTEDWEVFEDEFVVGGRTYGSYNKPWWGRAARSTWWGWWNALS